MSARIDSRHDTSVGFSKPGVVGFLMPLTLAILIGITMHMLGGKSPATNSAHTKPVASQTSSPVVSGVQPTADEISNADAAILSYCQNDLRQDTNCALVDGSNVTAPGFVESGVRMSGYFDGDNTSTDGLALSKGSGSSWSVIWIGQSCIPKNVASTNNVPTTLAICQ